MFFAILSTLLSSISTNLWKKALSFWAPKELFNLLSRSSIILVTWTLYLFWELDFSNVSFYYVFLLILANIIWSLNDILNQYVFSVEKISVLMPYSNLNKALSIVLSFFIFWWISNISFFITLLTIIIIILFSINFKSFKVPKVILLLIVIEIIRSALMLLSWYILLQITWSAFFVISYIIWIIFIWSIVTYKWQFKELKKLPKKFYIYRLSACHFWWVAYLLSVLVIKNLWLSVSILLSFIGVWITLFISYLIFQDKPSKKNLILTTLVMTLVWLWYYYK